MIKHIVLLAFAPNISERKVGAALDKLGNLRYKEIPQIISYSYGKNCSPEALDRGFNYVFVMEFVNLSDRDIYLKHPRHHQVATEDVLPLLSNGVNSVLVMDYSS
jgi:hypothetical protein